MSKFKVGDKVRVLRNISDNPCKDAYVGREYVVKNTQGASEQHGNRYGIGEVFVVFEGEIELVAPRYEIHITCTDGKTTHAVKKVDGKITARAKAVCAPDDEFDFAVGANLAYDRLMRPEVLVKCATETAPAEPAKEDKPKFKVGDRVKVIGSGNPYTHYAPIGSVQRVVGVRRTYVVVGYCGQIISFADIEPESTEPKQEPEKAEPEYLNMKVVCVEATDIGVTIGKVYSVENGVFTWNSGGKSATGATTIEQFNSWFVGAKFIEFKGE